MEQNRFAPLAPRPEAAADEPASSLLPPDDAPLLDPAPGDDFAFATEAEAEAYHAGLCDGIIAGGGKAPPRLEARTRAAYPEMFGGPDPARDPAYDFDGGDMAYTPVPLRPRADGWTPERQREFLDALADSGVVRYAAAKVGMSERGVNRLRRRADARAFDLACDAAMRHGARRLQTIAYERAIEGTIRRHYYHGELKSEERVYDNRLLVYLLGKTERLIDEPPEARAVAAQWEPWVEAIAEGREPPVLSEIEANAEAAPASAPAPASGPDAVFESRGQWWTTFPPPSGFDGQEEAWPGHQDYCRTLTEEEEDAMLFQAERETPPDPEWLARESRRRDLYFGFTPEGAGDDKEDRIFPLMEPGPSGPSEPSEERSRPGSLAKIASHPGEIDEVAGPPGEGREGPGDIRASEWTP